jgi:hypothetical protein
VGNVCVVDDETLEVPLAENVPGVPVADTPTPSVLLDPAV